MWRSHIKLVLFLPALFPNIANSQASIEMTPLPERLEPQALDGKRLEPQVIDGMPALREHWPATLKFKRASSQDEYNCTSTIVGEKTALTAAHCVEHGGSASIKMAGRFISLQCVHHPEFRDYSACRRAVEPPDTVGCTADLALCFSEQPIPIDLGKFERLRPKAPSAKLGASLPILGYGCTVWPGPGEEPEKSDALVIGDATVVALSMPGASKDPQKTYDEYVALKGGATMCIRDSGGASYTSANANSRELILIASRVSFLEKMSWYVNLTDPHIMNFVNDMRAKHQLAICGLDQSAKNCR